MDFVTQLLLNMLLVVTPVMMYPLFWIDRLQHIDDTGNRWAAAALAALSAVLSMTYPVQLADGFQYDMRFIALTACFMYTGTLPTLAVFAVVVLYRFMEGGAGAYVSLAITAVVFLFLWAVKRKIHPSALLQKPLVAGWIGLVVVAITAVLSIPFTGLGHMVYSPEIALFFVAYALTYMGTSVIIVCIVRQIRINLDLRKQIQQRDKMNLLSELAASFAHEIRNPMTVARGFVQMMKQRELTEEKRQVYNQMVLDELDRAQSIINDYLSFARPQMEALELLDAKQLVLRALEQLDTFAQLRNVRIEVDLQDKLMISANADKLTQCIVHLCRNGIESMPGGGILRIIGSVQSSRVSIDIIDQGIGMTEDEVGRLGTPYYTTRGKGTGLGMMVTYRVIQNIQGRIDVTSEQGKGTCFTITLPSLQPSSYH
ncbi:HAMP domain-containing sensor histidine kinase [Paenibacillus validus]|uniref:histidine kinase n=1 Tax=Paenibacillus validus TaxID=44253 RepID=A0A7X2Z7K9_9BACL|nr:HAMP domain-containing sensor histidine kinase [Paenibacillus validus]MUG69215.1 two-component sensor histidine kinase [Paenibacillus validus]